MLLQKRTPKLINIAMAEDEKQLIERLRFELRRHDYLYYCLSAPEITDRQYDELFDKLKNLEQQHSELITPDSPTAEI